MARRKSTTSSGLSTTLVIVLIIGVIAGFAAGFLVARHRDVQKISVISQMNMDKAVTIDNLNQQLEVLGASTKADK